MIQFIILKIVQIANDLETSPSFCYNMDMFTMAIKLHEIQPSILYLETKGI